MVLSSSDKQFLKDNPDFTYTKKPSGGVVFYKKGSAQPIVSGSGKVVAIKEPEKPKTTIEKKYVVTDPIKQQSYEATEEQVQKLQEDVRLANEEIERQNRIQEEKAKEQQRRIEKVYPFSTFWEKTIQKIESPTKRFGTYETEADLKAGTPKKTSTSPPVDIIEATKKREGVIGQLGSSLIRFPKTVSFIEPVTISPIVSAMKGEPFWLIEASKEYQDYKKKYGEKKAKEQVTEGYKQMISEQAKDISTHPVEFGSTLLLSYGASRVAGSVLRSGASKVNSKITKTDISLSKGYEMNYPTNVQDVRIGKGTVITRVTQKNPFKTTISSYPTRYKVMYSTKGLPQAQNIFQVKSLTQSETLGKPSGIKSESIIIEEGGLFRSLSKSEMLTLLEKSDETTSFMYRKNLMSAGKSKKIIETPEFDRFVTKSISETESIINLKGTVTDSLKETSPETGFTEIFRQKTTTKQLPSLVGSEVAKSTEKTIIKDISKPSLTKTTRGKSIAPVKLKTTQTKTQPSLTLKSTRTKLKEQTIQEQELISGSSVLLRQKSTTASKTRKEEFLQMPKTEQIQIPLQTPMLKPAIETKLVQKPKITPLLGTPVFPSITKTPKIDLPPLIPTKKKPSGGGSLFSSDNRKFFGQKKDYTPSLAGIFTGRTRKKKPKGKLTGLGLRLPIMRRKKK